MRRRNVAYGFMVAALGASTLVAVVSTSTAAPEVHITAAGDYGASPATGTVLTEIARRAPDAHLALGDLAYGYSPTPYAWCDYVEQFVGEAFPFQLISGNHESLDNNNGDINDFSACLPNQIAGITGTYGREYTMDFPRNAPLVRVIQASPNLTFENGRWTYTSGDAHFRWLSDAIDAGRAKGAVWTIVTAHHPCLTVGANGCPSVDDFYDLVIDKRVDLVLHGHDHSYARTHQLATGAPGCSVVPARTTDQDCIVDTDGAFGAGYGTVFATVGTGGIELRDVNPGDSEAGYFAAWSGANSQPTYGLLDLTITTEELRAAFVPTSGAGFTDAFTITRGLPAPTTSSPTTTSTTTSTTTTSSPTTTSTPSTTTATSTTTTSSTTSTPTTTTATTTTTTTTTVPTSLAADSFGRSVTGGWGSAEVGGAWSTSPSSAFTVASGVGTWSNARGTTRQTYLRNVSTTDADVRLRMSNNAVANGSGLYLSVVPRSIVGGGEYRAVVRTESNGRISVRLDRGSATIVQPTVIASSSTAGSSFEVRVQAVGTNPTTVRAKVWPSGTAEPSTWAVSTTDADPGLQRAGGIGLSSYLSSSATNSPVTAIDDLVVAAP